MGLSRKLGASNSRPAEPEGTAIAYKWSTQTYTMAELMSKFKLPCVVQCATDSCSVVWSDFQFDLRQPLLLFEKRTVQKVHAVSVSVPKISGPGSSVSDQGSAETLEEVGPPMAIPCDYDGWFGAAPKGQVKTVRHTRIEGVAKSTARRFLVTTKLPAFTSSRSAGGAGSGDLDGYVSHDILPGEVMKRVCVLDPSPADPDCPTIVRHNGPCLECLDEKDEDVLIPLSRRAIIYEIAELYPDDIERVFTMRQVVAEGNQKLPRVLKLTHGDPPLLAYAFTGMLRCYSVFTEETILAATLDDVASICLELATDSFAKFRLCLNETAMKRTCEYGNALHMCDTFGAKFITGIKVRFSLQPELLDLDDVDVSLYESQTSVSDMQEVEANSEFEISWRAVKKAKLYNSTIEDGHLKNETDNEDDSSSDAGLSENLLDIQKLDNGAVSDIYAVVKKNKPPTDSDSQQPRPFTEKEIADLMQRKGMLTSIGDSVDGKGISPLEGNRVRHNPLFYYFQKEDEKESESKDTGPKLTQSEIAAEKIQDRTNTKILEWIDRRKEKSRAENLPDIITAQVGQSAKTEEAVEDESNELDTSIYEQAICTPAREYSEDEIGGKSSSESDDDSSVLHNSLKKTNTEFPIEANVVIKSMPARATRNTLALNFRNKTFDTSSSDDVSSDLDRLDESKTSKRIQELLSPGNNKKPQASAVRDAHIPIKNTSKILSSPYKPNGLSFVNELVIDNSYRRSETNSVDAVFDSFKPNPQRPTFTEVDDPLEGALSELDMITSIKPASLTVEKFENNRNLKDDASSPSVETAGTENNEKGVQSLEQEKSANGLSGIHKKQRKVSISKERPEPPKAPKEKHADFMQTEDRFDSPKVLHHPHVHPHTTTALKYCSSEVSHLGRWADSVSLEGVEKTKTKVSDSILGFERLSSSASSDSNVSRNSTAQKPGLISTSNCSKLTKTDQPHDQTHNDKYFEMSPSRGIQTSLNSFEKKDKNTTAFNRNIYSRNLSQPDVYEPSHEQVGDNTESDEDITTIEEHFVVSTDSVKSSGTNLKVLPVYHEDLNNENFV